MRRSSLTPKERSYRSLAAKLVHFSHFLRGTVSVRDLTCGKANCRCARGQLHSPVYLVQSSKGKPRQLFVPKHWEEDVRKAVKNYQWLQKLLEELSELEWRRVKERRE